MGEILLGIHLPKPQGIQYINTIYILLYFFVLDWVRVAMCHTGSFADRFIYLWFFFFINLQHLKK